MRHGPHKFKSNICCVLGLQTFPDREELLRNMMGLLGNVAEVKELRHRLMTQEFIKVFKDLLSSSSDGIEVSIRSSRSTFSFDNRFIASL